MDTPNARPKRATDLDRLVGERIQVLRKSKGLTQTALGQAIGVTFQQVQKYENGMNRVGASRLSDIARVLEVRVSSFYDGDEGEGEDRAEVFGFLRTHGAIDLLRAFSEIDDDQLRREVLAIVRTVARVEQVRDS
ncbi:helix-turn-helix domain-containing protein [Methylorubrum extorquens]|uniref:helix-turn-helix domain-containing protein n=1 Tax=Methylorubrum extorquens TaxID=408 RepID=UPI00223879F3|nr:helix-turn-helix transcriptional regulator [Methylorubrum extorquens]UYW24866.1 helix-turn-helix domain-containing protein [Methylorubrum extorquens]